MMLQGTRTSDGKRGAKVYIYIHVCTSKMGDLTSVLPIDRDVWCNYMYRRRTEKCNPAHYGPPRRESTDNV